MIEEINSIVGSGVLRLKAESEFIPPAMSVEIASEIWRELHWRVRESISSSINDPSCMLEDVRHDPLSPEERALYQALTARLTFDANFLGTTVITKNEATA